MVRSIRGDRSLYWLSVPCTVDIEATYANFYTVSAFVWVTSVCSHKFSSPSYQDHCFTTPMACSIDVCFCLGFILFSQENLLTVRLDLQIYWRGRHRGLVWLIWWCVCVGMEIRLWVLYLVSAPLSSGDLPLFCFLDDMNKQLCFTKHFLTISWILSELWATSLEF